MHCRATGGTWDTQIALCRNNVLLQTRTISGTTDHCRRQLYGESGRAKPVNQEDYKCEQRLLIATSKEIAIRLEDSSPDLLVSPR
jgi:hypothetical protein